jgi:hypothetical protein
MPIILATQKAEIRRIVFQSQPWTGYLEETHPEKRLGECFER